MVKRIGILLGQLGTPEAPTTTAVRRYLRQFLSDRRVVDLNPVLWWLILNCIVLVTRPKKSAKLYQKVWTEEGSPLLSITKAQAAGLQERLNHGGDESTRWDEASLPSHPLLPTPHALVTAVEYRVEVAMRYGNPSTRLAIDNLLAWGAEQILLFPMYPQYSAATTASTYDEVFLELSRRRFVPALRVVPPYYDDRDYIRALAKSVQEKLAALEGRPGKILLSFHGIPKRYAQLGDPYPDHCQATATALAKEMGWTSDEYLVTFQSRFGREEWLQPYTDQTLIKLGGDGVRNLMVLCPGFTADCLETIDEIGNLGHEQFRSTGGQILDLVPCFNARPDWLDAMTTIARRELRGW